MEDRFRYVSPDIVENKTITKRFILAELSTLFDLLCLINPVILKAKIFMQDLWILKLKWDESLLMNLHRIPTKIKDGTESNGSQIYIGRKCNTYELHGFSDAYLPTYGCCVYVRTVDAKDNVTVHC